MKCPNCGADMKEGSLYCEQCGEDIHIVPDFEPELEYNLEQSLHDIVKDIHVENTMQMSAGEQIAEEEAENEEQDQDWDQIENNPNVLHKKSYRLFIVIAILLFVVFAGSISAVLLFRYYSVDYQIAAAQKSVSAENYDDAVTYYSRALELEPGSVDLKFSLAEVYFLKSNKIEYEYLLREIVNDKNASAEQLESAYGKLIAIYRAREDWK